MALTGELSGTAGATCTCGMELELQVLSSAAGYYLGYFCNECGPWSRETGYYPTREMAKKDLSTLVNLRDTEFHPDTLTVIEVGSCSNENSTQ